MKLEQVFDYQDMPGSIRESLFAYYYDRIEHNNCYITLYMGDIKEDCPELYNWLIEDGYDEKYGDPLLVIWW